MTPKDDTAMTLPASNGSDSDNNHFRGPVLVTGLPRSGTTTIIATFATHPQLQLYTSGRQRDRFECRELLPEREPDFGRIGALHHSQDGRRLLVKRPWLHVRHPQLLRSFIIEFKARVVIALRDMDGLRSSWEGRGRRAVNSVERASLGEIFVAAKREAFRLEAEGLACTTWLPFLPGHLRQLELERLAAWVGIDAEHLAFVSRP